MHLSSSCKIKLILGGLNGALALLSTISPASAQLGLVPDTAPDRSTNTTVNPENARIDIIRGGTRPQNSINLFHSFEEFNVGEGRGVYFENPTGVENIFGRVTGTDPSNILGRLGVLNPNRTFGNANLFLLNPNGILFGPNAQLDLSGSFTATTAHAIEFGDLGWFSATNPTIPTQLLTINPSAYLFSQTPSGNITVSTTTTDPVGSSFRGLRVGTGDDLTLLGGNVTINGGGLSAGLIALGGRVNVGAIAAPGRVGLDTAGRLSIPDSLTRGDIELTNRARILVSSSSGGEIYLTARNITLSGGSQLQAGISDTSADTNPAAGDIRFDATEAIQITQSSSILNLVTTDTTGNSGNIEMTTGSLDVLDGSQLVAVTGGQGNAGNVRINARDRVRFAGASTDGRFSSAAFSRVNSTGVGQAGNIEITTGTLEVLNGAGLTSSTLGQGNAGSILINAGDRVRFEGTRSDGGFGSSALSSVGETGIGQGGNIEITTRTLEVLGGAQLIAVTSGQGSAGNVIVNARDRVRFAGASPDGEYSSAAFSRVDRTGIGQGGDIQITTGSLEVLNGAGLTSSTQGQGNAGNVRINARDRVRFDGIRADGDFASSALSSVERTAIGHGGNIQISTGTLEMLNGAQLVAGTSGQGNAGSVIIHARDRVRFDSGTVRGESVSAAFSRVNTTGNGRGGNIEITTGTLELLNGAQLVANTQGQGNAGNVIVNARDRVRFAGRSADGQFGSIAFSRVNETGTGNGGNIQISTGTLEILNGGQLVASTRGQGNAGNVRVNARDRVRFAAGSALSTVGETGIGNGGNIQISTGTLEILNGGQLVASTRGQGNAGNVILNAREAVRVRGVRNGLSSAVSTSSTATARGQGGDLIIQAGSIQVTAGAVLDARTSSAQRGGNITLTTEEFSALDGGQVTATARDRGSAGNITLTAEQVLLSGRDTSFATRFRQFPNRTLNEGQGQSGLFTSTQPNSSGTGGTITVNANNLRIEARATISAQSQGRGNAGDIHLTVPNQLSLHNGNIITAANLSSGGDIQINATSNSADEIRLGTRGIILLEGDSDITTNSRENGGNIRLGGAGIIAFDDSDIIASSRNARGGNITLGAFFSETIPVGSAQNFDHNQQVDVNASGQTASGQITAPDTSFVQNSLADLPDTTVDVNQLLANSCIARTQTNGTFLVTGAGGLPQNPGTIASTPYPTGEVRSLPTYPSPPLWKIGDPIVEPQGMYQLNDGRWVMSRVCERSPRSVP